VILVHAFRPFGNVAVFTGSRLVLECCTKFTLSGDISQLVICRHSSTYTNNFRTSFYFLTLYLCLPTCVLLPTSEVVAKKFLLLTDSRYFGKHIKSSIFVRVKTCNAKCGNIRLAATLLKMAQTIDCQGCQSLWKMIDAGKSIYGFFLLFGPSHGRIRKTFFRLKIPDKTRKMSNLRDHED
jgi:hypothetical protein